MMITSYFLSVLSYVLKAAGIISFDAVFFRRAERKEYFAVKFGFGVAAMIALALLFSVYIIIELDKRINYVFYSVYLFAPYIILLLCYRINKLNSFVCYMAAIVFVMAGTRASDLTVYLLSVAGADEAFLGSIAGNIYYAVFVAAVTVLLAVFCGDIFDFFLRASLPRRTLLLPLLIASMNLLFGVISPRVTMLEDVVYTVLVYLFEILYCALFFILFMYFITQVRTAAKNIVLENMFKQYEKQYKQFEQNIRIINCKSHDLRFNLSGAVRDEETARALEGYESQANTGNALLDVILTDMGYRSADSDVQFVCSADGKLLSFMNETDMYALFGNAFENALEYLRTRPKEERFISVTLKRKMDIVHLHFENSFSGTLRLKDGLPETTKTDSDTHGFGMRSIRRIAEKYGGTAQASVRDDMFQLDIIFSACDS